jgi:hypothetical protein
MAGRDRDKSPETFGIVVEEIRADIAGLQPAQNGTARGKPPGTNQSVDGKRTWYLQHARPGLIVVVLNRQRGVSEYCLDEIVRVHPRGHRLHLRQNGIFSPCGRPGDTRCMSLSLLIPTMEVLQCAINGVAWLNDRPAYRRELSDFELGLCEAGRLHDLLSA